MPYYSEKIRKMSQKLSSAAVVIGDLRVNDLPSNFCLYDNVCLDALSIRSASATKQLSKSRSNSCLPCS